MEGDDEPLNKLRRELQELKSRVLEMSSQITDLRARLITISEMLEDRDQH